MPTCPYCESGHKSAEVLGWQVHKFSDRWVTCAVQNALILSNFPLDAEQHFERKSGNQRADWAAYQQKSAAAS